MMQAVNSFGRNFMMSSLWWLFAIVIWTTVTHSEIEINHEFAEHFRPWRVLTTVSIALVLAFLNSLMDWFLEPNKRKFKISFRKKMLIVFFRQFVFIVLIVAVLFAILRLNVDLAQSMDDDFRSFLMKFQVGRFWIYAVFVSYIFEVIRAIDLKLGPGNLWKLMIGAFSKPKELERIFMFLDLQGSTTLAERLGHLKYSELIQDCFHDVSVVQRHGAEIFQYVGDEVVLVWKPIKGLSSFNCIEAYFSFMNRISDKKEYYEKKYGVLPFFKAGIHIGKIVLAEVGEVKSEIAYHGDTINTASRIQKKCNEFSQSLVVSEKLIQAFGSVSVQSNYLMKKLGSVNLKGKDEQINIVGLQKK